MSILKTLVEFSEAHEEKAILQEKLHGGGWADCDFGGAELVDLCDLIASGCVRIKPEHINLSEVQVDGYKFFVVDGPHLPSWITQDSNEYCTSRVIRNVVVEDTSPEESE